MEMHQIRYFIAAAELLNFTRAAEACNVTQPVLTRAIQKLEDELGGPLFRREGRRTHLTELGRKVHPRFEQALSLTRLAQEEALDFSRMVSAKLDLGCMCTIAPTRVISLVQFFSQKAPQLELCIHEATGRRLIERLLAGELDVALVALPVPSDELHAHALFEERYLITFPKGHRFEKLNSVPVSELDGENYLRRLNCEYLDVFASQGFEIEGDIVNRFQSEHESWVQAMVIAGLGCAVMPESLATNPELQSRPLVDPEIKRTVSIVTRRGRRHTPVVDFVVDLCRRIDWGPTKPAPEALAPCGSPHSLEGRDLTL